jgi:isoleucyl-tRNA synthetase
MQALNGARIESPDLDTLEAAVEDETGLDVDLDPEMVEFVTETPDSVSGTEFEALGSAGVVYVGTTLNEALDSSGVVYVDTTLTEDLESEGYAREVIRRIQEMRKDLELDLEAQIRVDVGLNDERVSALIERHEDLVAEEVRAAEFEAVEDGYRKEWDVEGVEMEIAIEEVPEAAA